MTGLAIVCYSLVMRLLVFALAPLLLANVYMWWSVSVIASLCWAVVLIASPKLLPE